jgi:hypothetical protein
MASSKAFKSERVIWRAVIQLNVVRSVHLILTLMTEAQAAQTVTQSPSFRPLNLPDSHSPPPVRLPRLTPELLRLKIRLSPLVQVEEALVRKLQISSGQESAVSVRAQEQLGIVQRELAVHSASGWKGNFVARILAGNQAKDDGDGDGIDWDDPNDPGRVIHACRDDMMRLWDDLIVRELLDAKQMRMQEMSGLCAAVLCCLVNHVD